MSASNRSEWNVNDWRLVAESIPHMVGVADANGSTLFFNQHAAAYFGPSDESTGWVVLAHPDDLERAVTSWMRSLLELTEFEEDVRLRRADGEYRWHVVRARPLVGGDGAVAAWFGTATDVEHQKEGQQRLLLAEREAAATVLLLTELQSAAPAGIGYIDSDLRVVRLNDELAELGGRPPVDLVGRTVAEIMPDLWRQLEPVLDHVLRAGEAVRNLPITRPPLDEHGPHREWLVSLYPVRVGEIAGVGVVALDVTARLRAEGFRSTVMGQLTDGVYTVDRDGMVTYLNRAASKMLGWTEDELRGRSMHDMVHFQRVDGTPMSPTDCVLLQEGTDRRLVRAAGEVFTRKDGTIFPVAYSSMPLRVGSRVEGVSVVFRDISEDGPSTHLIRVLVVTADPAESDALTSVVTRHDELEVIGVSTSVGAAVEEARRLRPDVILVDNELPNAGGASACARIKSEAPASALLLLALEVDDAIAAAAIADGCSGIINKRRMWVDLPGAVRSAHHGETSLSQVELQQVLASVRSTSPSGRAEDLTPRERDVLRCLIRGLNNQQAAKELGMKVNTVRNHVQRILYKLDVHSRLEAVALATQRGLLNPPR